jgi:hypothetical protein
MSGSSLPGTGQAGCSGNSLGRLYSWAGPDQSGRSAGFFGILATALPGTFQDLPNLTMLWLATTTSGAPSFVCSASLRISHWKAAERQPSSRSTACPSSLSL